MSVTGSQIEIDDGLAGSVNLLMGPIHKERQRRRNDIFMYGIELGIDQVVVENKKCVL